MGAALVRGQWAVCGEGMVSRKWERKWPRGQRGTKGTRERG